VAGRLGKFLAQPAGGGAREDIDKPGRRRCRGRRRAVGGGWASPSPRRISSQPKSAQTAPMISSMRSGWAASNIGCRCSVRNTKKAWSAKTLVAASTDGLVLSHEPSILGAMRLRYRFRVQPTPAQREALAKAFGCARVVYNDGLRLREEAYMAGLPWVSDGNLVRLVTTEAKRTPQRAWLTEVSAVVLQQSVADLHRAYRNYFAALVEVKAERAKGNKQAKLRVHKPKPKRRRQDQAIRFTANSRFRVLSNGRLRLPKVGDLRVRWSRELPSTPSSVTITLDGAGRYHASFVIQVQEAPVPSTPTQVGIDLGLTHFATLSTGEKVANPRWLRQRQKALRRAQRSLSRRQKGSKNRDKQRRKVAKMHARVADARRDFHHQLSTRLIRENQTVVAEDLNVAGLGRSNLARSIHDAGWSSFVAMLEYKAALSGRRFVKINQWHPSSQLCSACGQQSGPKGLNALKVRTWTCLACDTEHDRDVNAALNILAAGQAVAACGPDVRPPARVAAGVEAGTALAGAA
jgi:IS605 OrfB family transposase